MDDYMPRSQHRVSGTGSGTGSGSGTAPCSGTGPCSGLGSDDVTVGVYGQLYMFEKQVMGSCAAIRDTLIENDSQQQAAIAALQQALDEGMRTSDAYQAEAESLREWGSKVEVRRAQDKLKLAAAAAATTAALQREGAALQRVRDLEGELCDLRRVSRVVALENDNALLTARLTALAGNTPAQTNATRVLARGSSFGAGKSRE